MGVQERLRQRVLSKHGTATLRSKRPGRVSAGSRLSGMLVAAMTITPSFTWPQT